MFAEAMLGLAAPSSMMILAAEGDIPLRDPVTPPNLSWIAGAVLLALAAFWVTFCIVRWRRQVKALEAKPMPTIPDLHELTRSERRRFMAAVEEIDQKARTGQYDARETHLALAGLLRAVGTARTGRDLEVATISEIKAMVPQAPDLVAALAAVEAPSFDVRPAHPGEVAAAIDAARRAVAQP